MDTQPIRPKLLTADDYVAGVLADDRATLARAITLVESGNPRHQAMAQEVLGACVEKSGHACRVGVTGVPGAGKSTTIDQLGLNLLEAGHKVAVLAVDPTSRRTGGSILGDKTRMARLAVEPNAFIRPSPTSGTLGGVTKKTRETMVLCEAAGFDVILVETVGVGQSETAVAEMVDFFLVLLLAGGGDELQGIKKGIIEIADMIAINKADGDNVLRAQRSASEYRTALHLLQPASPDWSPPVITISGFENTGLDELWAKIEEYRSVMTETGALQRRREDQAIKWMWDMIEERLLASLKANTLVQSKLPVYEEAVRSGRMLPSQAVDALLSLSRRPEVP